MPDPTKKKAPPKKTKGMATPAVSGKPSFTEELQSQDTPGRKDIFRGATMTFNYIREIRKDPVVKFCIGFLGVAVKRAEIVYSGTTGDDELDQRVSYFLAEVFDPIMVPYLGDCVYALEFGFRSWEVRWQMFYSRVFGSDRIGLKTFKPILPDYVQIMEEPETGSLEGIRVLQPRMVELLTKDSKALLYTHRYDPTPSGKGGGRYGRTEFEEIKTSYEEKQYFKALMRRYLETKGDPATKAFYDPSATLDSNNQAQDPAKEALNLADSAKQGRSVALPAFRDLQTGKVDRLWDLEYLEGNDKMPGFREALEIENTEIMRGLLVPERSISQGDAGTFAMAKEHATFLIVRQEDLLTSFLDVLNLYIVPRVLALNFPETNVMGEISSPGIGNENIELAKIVVQAFASGGFDKITPEQREYLARATGIPFPMDMEVEAPEDKTVVKVEPKGEGEGEGKDGQGAPGAGSVAPVGDLNGKEEGPDAQKKTKARRVFARTKVSLLGNIKPNRALTQWEEKGNFIQFGNQWGSLEITALNQLSELVGAMADRFRASLSGILNGEKKQERRASQAADISLAYLGKYESTLKGLMMEFALLGAGSALAQVNKKPVADLTPSINTVVSVTASVTAESNLARLTTLTKMSALNGINRDRSEAQILWDVKEAFEQFKTNDLPNSIRNWGGAMVNAGRMIVEDMAERGEMGEDNDVVGYTRSAVLDDKVCELCLWYDGMLIPKDHPDVGEFIAQQHFGERCQVGAVLKSESQDYPYKKYRRPPSDIVEDNRGF